MAKNISTLIKELNEASPDFGAVIHKGLATGSAYKEELASISLDTVTRCADTLDYLNNLPDRFEFPEPKDRSYLILEKMGDLGRLHYRSKINFEEKILPVCWWIVAPYKHLDGLYQEILSDEANVKHNLDLVLMSVHKINDMGVEEGLSLRNDDVKIVFGGAWMGGNTPWMSGRAIYHNFVPHYFAGKDFHSENLEFRKIDHGNGTRETHYLGK